MINFLRELFTGKESGRATELALLNLEYGLLRQSISVAKRQHGKVSDLTARLKVVKHRILELEQSL